MLIKSIIIVLIGLVLHDDNSIEVKPGQIELNSSLGQIVTRNLEVSNLSDNFISIKTKFDSTWISVFPSKFILLPKQKKNVLTVFSINKNALIKREGKITFWSLRGGEKDVLIRISFVEPDKTPKTLSQKESVKPPLKDLNQRIEIMKKELERMEVELFNLQQLISKHENRVEKLILKYSRKNLPQK